MCRLRDNADDNFLQIVEGTDVFALLRQMPRCRTIVTTGGKASQELQSYLQSHGLKVQIPRVGESVTFPADALQSPAPAPLLRWWRMPSSSRAYPMKLEKKAEYYRRLFE